MKKFTKTILAAAVMAVMVLGAGCGQKEEAPAEQAPTEQTGEQTPESNTDGEQASQTEGGKLIMATNAEFPPYEYRENQEFVGIDVEIAQEIAKSIGKELQIEDMAFDSIIPALVSGKADIGVAGITVTEDKLLNVDFTDTYVQASQAIIIKTDNTEITGPDSLEGKTIGVQLGTTGDQFASDVKDSKVERYNKGFEAVQALAQGKIDAVIIDDQVAKALAAESEAVKVLDEPFTTEEYAIAVKKGNTELVDQINTALKELKDSGKLQEIVDKYITAE